MLTRRQEGSPDRVGWFNVESVAGTLLAEAGFLSCGSFRRAAMAGVNRQMQEVL